MPTPIQAQNRSHLALLIIQEIHAHGNECSLNHIDVSNVDNMNSLFKDMPFNGDVSEWDVSNVKAMAFMFSGSTFNGDISKWNTSQVQDMGSMFAWSSFNQDIYKWNTSQVRNMNRMFQKSQFNGDISQWDVSNVTNVSSMFRDCPFAQDVRGWSLPIDVHVYDMFQENSRARWPSQVLVRLRDIFPDTTTLKKYLHQSYLRETHAGHVVRALELKTKPAYFNKATTEKIKAQYDLAESLGMSLQEAALYIFEQLSKPDPTVVGFHDFELS